MILVGTRIRLCRERRDFEVDIDISVGHRKGPRSIGNVEAAEDELEADVAADRFLRPMTDVDSVSSDELQDADMMSSNDGSRVGCIQ